MTVRLNMIVKAYAPQKVTKVKTTTDLFLSCLEELLIDKCNYAYFIFQVGGQKMHYIRYHAELLVSNLCAYCGKPAEGEFSIHRDGFGAGPDVPLCNECGSGVFPTCEEIWSKTRRE